MFGYIKSFMWEQVEQDTSQQQPVEYLILKYESTSSRPNLDIILWQSFSFHNKYYHVLEFFISSRQVGLEIRIIPHSGRYDSTT